jgi:hypothetical protein
VHAGEVLQRRGPGKPCLRSATPQQSGCCSSLLFTLEAASSLTWWNHSDEPGAMLTAIQICVLHVTASHTSAGLCTLSHDMQTCCSTQAHLSVAGAAIRRGGRGVAGYRQRRAAPAAGEPRESADPRSAAAALAV